MITNSVQVGFQPAGTLGPDIAAENLVQVVLRMRQIFTWLERFLTISQAPVPANDRREGGHNREGILFGKLLSSDPEGGRRHPQRIHHRNGIPGSLTQKG